MTAGARLTRAEAIVIATMAICLAMLVITSLAALVDDRLLRDVSVWSKPIKFALSFALHLLTMLVFARCLDEPARTGRWAALALATAAVATLIEVLYVALQSARGRPSHFNTATLFETVMYYPVMGGAAVALVAATALIGVLILRHPGTGIGPGLRAGAGWGAVLSAVATLVVAGVLASGVVTGAGPWVGVPRTDAGGLPLLGWSRQTGDLRVAHFFATHLMQAMAIAGWLADRLSSRPTLARAAVLVVALIGLAMTAATFLQALAGGPFIPLAAGLAPIN